MVVRRREFMIGVASAMATSSGCCILRRKPDIPCLGSSKYTDPSAPLIIDPHSHVFNATDLPVKDFFNLIGCRRAGHFQTVCTYFGGIIQSIAWAAAPSAEEELTKLESLAPGLRHCEDERSAEMFYSIRNDRYKEARDELQDEASRLLRISGQRPLANLSTLRPNDSRSFGAQLLMALPDSYRDFERGDFLDDFSMLEADLRVTIFSALDFIIEMFQYRIASVSRYFEDYGSGDIKIDLITPSLVDFDWPLSSGAPTRSSLGAQLRVMEKIAVVTGGRVHPIVPFDPFREVAARLGRDDSSFEFVQSAVNSGLAAGVKLYPPMGFAPSGNADLPSSFWDRPWLSDIVQVPKFNEMLDDVLGDLFSWCQDKSVPVLSHSNRSNGPTDDFEDLVSPSYWAEAASDNPGLKVNFGHLGGIGSSTRNDDWQAYLGLMNASGAGASLFADASYFSDALVDSEDEIVALLVRLITEQPLVSERLTYGSDWKMLALEADADEYLKIFARAAGTIEGELRTEEITSSFKQRFLGGNAANWLGLANAEGNRMRMRSFYSRNGVDDPPWIEKTAIPKR